MNTDMIAFEAEMKRLRGAYIMDIAPACEMYRAALARVAELEAQLDVQGWRPVTEKPPLDTYYLTDDTLPSGNEPWIVNYYNAAHGWANGCRVWLCPPPLPPDKNAGAE